ncbi:hypothetical protein GJ496_001208 [Pomphorhynchus laevis]|nr:hypothetical protein GJ496_001208 [Pomphorhynchus laevis]
MEFRGYKSFVARSLHPASSIQREGTQQKILKNGQISRALRLLYCETTVEGIHCTSDIVRDKSVLSIQEELYPSSSNAAERVILEIRLKDHYHVTQLDNYSRTKTVFANTGVFVLIDGLKILNAPIGTKEYCSKKIKEKVSILCGVSEKLTMIAGKDAHVAYYALMVMLLSKWIVMQQTYCCDPD